MNDSLSEILKSARKLVQLLEGQRKAVLDSGSADLEVCWARAMTETWQAIPESVRLRSTACNDPLAPTDTERRLPCAVRLLAEMSLVGGGFVREKATGDVYLDLGAVYAPDEHWQGRAVRIYASALNGRAAEEGYPLVLRWSEFKIRFAPVSEPFRPVDTIKGV